MDNGASSYLRFRDDGDESGLVEIIRDYKDGLIFFLCGIVGDITVAEELAEDTFVLLGTKKPKDKGKSSFKTWLYTIGRNIAVDYLRKRKRGDSVSLESCPELTSDEASLEETYLSEEQKITLHRAMRALKNEYRQVLWLVYFDGLSVKEAASVLKKTVHSTETLLYRARKELKKQLESEGFDYENI